MQSLPDHTRVVTIGVPVEQVLENPEGHWGWDHSIELCGGT